MHYFCKKQGIKWNIYIIDKGVFTSIEKHFLSHLYILISVKNNVHSQLTARPKFQNKYWSYFSSSLFPFLALYLAPLNQIFLTSIFLNTIYLLTVGEERKEEADNEFVIIETSIDKASTYTDVKPYQQPAALPYVIQPLIRSLRYPILHLPVFGYNYL